MEHARQHEDAEADGEKHERRAQAVATISWPECGDADHGGQSKKRPVDPVRADDRDRRQHAEQQRHGRAVHGAGERRRRAHDIERVAGLRTVLGVSHRDRSEEERLTDGAPASDVRCNRKHLKPATDMRLSINRSRRRFARDSGIHSSSRPTGLPSWSFVGYVSRLAGNQSSRRVTLKTS